MADAAGSCPAPRESGLPRGAALPLLFVCVSVLTRWLALRIELLDTDEAAHAVGSWVLLDGGRLYTEFVDNKPPLLYVYYALAQVLLGRGLMAVHVVTALVTVPLTALAASTFFRRDRRGAVAGLLWLFYGAAFLAHDVLAAHAELILLLPASWAIVLVADEARARRPGPLFAAGLLLGVAALVKHHAACWLPVIAWAAVRVEGRGARRLRRLAAVAAGFALPLAATWAAFAWTGGAGDLIYWLLWRNGVYAVNPIPAREAAARAAGSLLPWLLATAPLWWFWIRSRPLLQLHTRRLIDGLVACSFVAAFAGFRFFPHYFVPVVLPLALGAAPAAADALRRPIARSGLALLAATLVLVLGFQAANVWLYRAGARVYRETDPVYEAVAVRLAADPCFAGSRLFVWGWAPAFYYEAGLRGVRPASRFAVLAQAGLTGYIAGNRASVEGGAAAPPVARHWDLLMGDLERNRATYVLDTAPAGIYRWNRFPLRDWPRLDTYVQSRYALLDTVGGVRIYRRQGCVAETSVGGVDGTRLVPSSGLPGAARP